jgi:hypothetical protein
LIHVADAAVGVFCDLEFGAQFVEKATLPSKGQILLVNSEYGNPRSPHSYSHRIGTTADCHDLQRLGPLSDLTSAFSAQSNRTPSWATTRAIQDAVWTFPIPPLVRVGLHLLCFENAMPNCIHSTNCDNRRIYTVALAVTQAQSVGARKGRRRWIWVAAEVDPNDIALTRNHVAIDDAQHETPLAYY